MLLKKTLARCQNPAAVCISGPPGSQILSRFPPIGAPPSAVGDPTEFLHIHVDQLPWEVDFVPAWKFLAHWQAGGQVNALQSRHLVPVKNPTHGEAWDAQVSTDPVRTPPAVEPQADDPALSTLGQAVRTVVGPAGTVFEPVAFSVAGHPFRDRGRRDLESLSDPALSPPVVDNQDYDASPSLRGQRSSTVKHRRPPYRIVSCGYPHRYRRSPLLFNPVHNVSRNYSGMPGPVPWRS